VIILSSARFIWKCKKGEYKIINKFFINVAVNTFVILCNLLESNDVSEQPAVCYSLCYEAGTYLLLPTVLTYRIGTSVASHFN
jgi:hypothetical protein